jgi:phage baseplate assembly protein W
MPITILTPLTKRKTIYSDFEKNLDLNPLTNDLILLKNESSVSESIKNLVLTDHGERLMQPEIGGNVRNSLFENMTPASLKVLEQQITDVINNYEPRSEIISVIANGLYDQNAVLITIKYYIISKQEAETVEIFLERVR